MRKNLDYECNPLFIKASAGLARTLYRMGSRHGRRVTLQVLMFTQEQAKLGIFAEWQRWERPARTNARSQMLPFYLWIYNHRAELVAFRCRGDRWQKIHGWLCQYEERLVRRRKAKKV